MSFEDVRASLEAIVAAERSEPLIDPENGSRFWLHEKRATRCVVLLHGFTNNPRQYAKLGPYLYDAGYNVIAPRFAYHGFRDRMTTALARLTMNDLIETTLQAVTLAAGAGKRVSVAGISLGGAIAAWLAPRVAIDTAVAVAPFFGVKQIFGGANDALGSTLERLPNAFLWWDPIHKEQQLPRHGYPRFSTQALGQTLKLSAQTEKGGWRKSGRVVGLLNGKDPIVNNAFAQRRLEALRARGLDVRIDVRTDLPKQHDIIEPTLEVAPIGLSYPWILNALGGP